MIGHLRKVILTMRSVMYLFTINIFQLIHSIVYVWHCQIAIMYHVLLLKLTLVTF